LYRYVVLAEMADPANSRFDPDKGVRWAKHVITHRRDLVLLLLDIMGNNGKNSAFKVEMEKMAAQRKAAAAAAAEVGNSDAKGVATSEDEKGGGGGGGVDGSMSAAAAAAAADAAAVARRLRREEEAASFNVAAAAAVGDNRPAMFTLPSRVPSGAADNPPPMTGTRQDVEEDSANSPSDSDDDDDDSIEEPLGFEALREAFERRRERAARRGGGGGGTGASAAPLYTGDDDDAVFVLTPDCAHIAAAAVFGIISWVRAGTPGGFHIGYASSTISTACV
jgi:hypothetical protein